MNGGADRLAKAHEQSVYVRPQFLRQPGFQSQTSLFGFLGRFWHPTQAIGDAMHMYIHPDAGYTVPGRGHADVGHLRTHPWQGYKILHVVRYVAIVVVQQYAGRLV